MLDSLKNVYCHNTVSFVYRLLFLLGVQIKSDKYINKYNTIITVKFYEVIQYIHILKYIKYFNMIIERLLFCGVA